MDWDSITDRISTVSEGMGRGMKRMFGSRNERVVSKLQPVIDQINAKESWAAGLDAEGMQEQTRVLQKAVQEDGKTLDDVLPEAFALVREAAKRTLAMRHFDVQLVGGVILHNGAIAEMMTGEGKTLVATLPLYLNALSGRTPFLVTVNDYLARRDAQWMSPIYNYLGMSVGAIQANMSSRERGEVYASDIVYGTNNEFGFDYLRDNMKNSVEEQVQRDLSFAIIDEVDSILIDESRTPLIISGPAERMADKYLLADKVARALKREEHFEVKEKERSVSLLEDGIVEAEKIVGAEFFSTQENMDWPHYIENALRAHYLYTVDDQYVVEQGEVVIVDEFTGRKMNGRRWSDGLHQAVETKEKLQIRDENQTLATITFQNYFRLYDKLAGMTGTAVTEAGEFLKIYGLDVVQVPTHLPISRDDDNDVVYRTEPEKWKALVEELKEVHERGQPCLVGTASVENSEKLSGLLKKAGVPHEVLNAKQHEREAHIVAKAGEKGAVTVSTNMAGRGTDIKLGGNFEYRLNQALSEAGLELGDPEHLSEIDRIRDELREQTSADEKVVLELGGLYVLGTERHESRRIDNQLRGRSGRQGDVGVSRFFLSLEDPLMRRFYRDWVKNAMGRLGMSEGVPIESRMVSRAIEKAQKKVEDYHFEIRKNLLEYDEVMDEQRKTVYTVRQEVLENVGLREKVEEMLPSVVTRHAATFSGDAEGFAGWFHRTFGIELDEETATKATVERDNDPQGAIAAVMAAYDEREERFGGELMRQIERFLLLRTLDAKWKDHLRAIDALKAGIGLRGYAQKDPKNEYKAEGFELFERLLEAVEDEVASLILRVQVQQRAPEGEARPAGAGNFASPPSAYAGAVAGAPARQTRPAARPPAQPQRVPAALAFDQARQMAQRREAVRRAQEAARAEQAGAEASETSPAGEASPVAKAETYPGAGRNEPCPCGSGKKYKKCHGRMG